MSMINFVITAVDRASGTFTRIGVAADALAGQLDAATAKADQLNRALDGQAAAARAASGALDDLAKNATLAAKASDIAAVKIGAAAAAAEGLAAAGGGAGGGGWGWVGALQAMGRARIPLFGGALPGILATVGGVHLLVDGVAEFLAVAVPATLAGTAFGIAASDAVSNVIRQMTNMHTVMDATGRAIPPMTDDLEKLHQAVQPQVYQVFGDALLIMNNRAGQFGQIAKSTGTVVDQLAARLTVAITHGSGLSQFMANAVTDFAKIGDIAGNLGGALGNLLKDVPGYAQDLLNVADAGTRVLEWATAVTSPVIRAGLAFHGAFLYIGVAATVADKMVSGGLSKIGGLAERAGAGLMKLGGPAATAGRGMRLFGAASTDAAALPWGWIAVAAAGIGFLAYEMVTAKDAAQQWMAGLQSGILNSKTLVQGVAALRSAYTQVGDRAALAWKTMDQVTASGQKYVSVTTMGMHGITSTVRELNPAYASAQKAASDYGSGLRQLTDEQTLYQYRVGALAGNVGHLSRTYGSAAAAQGLLTASGVTMSQMLDKSKETWLEIQTQVAATAAGYNAMGQKAGTLGNDLAMLNKQSTDQYNAMQNLNSGWDTFIGNVTKTQSAFDSYVQGLTSVSQAAAKNNATMDGLNKNSVALNQAFTSQISTTGSLFDTWRQAGVSNSLFTRGVKDSIAPMVQYAKGSQEAADQLTALAEQAGYQGPAAMSSLVKWLGNTHDATQNVKDITGQATQQEALLTSAMQAQGTYLADKLTDDINNAILAYNGVQKAAQAYGNAIAKDGQQSDAAHAARRTLIQDIIDSGSAAGDATKQIAAMIAKVLHIPLSRAIRIVMTGDGNYTITQAGMRAGTYAGGGYQAMQNPAKHAAGGLIRGPGTTTSDSVLIAASNREYMVRAASVAKYGTRAMDAVNQGRAVIGYAQGGLVGEGNRNVLSGQYAVQMSNAFQSSMTHAMVTAMQSALQQAIASAAVPGGFGIQPNGPVQEYAKKLLQAYGWASQWPQFNDIVMRESGWNVHAQNPSGAYGIPQALPASKMASAGPDWRTSPYTQLRWMMAYLLERWHSPAAADANEIANHWYAKGTRGALPGWAWVGEEGPELVRMRGGEDVLPHHLSMLATHHLMRGYASGTSPADLVRAYLHGTSAQDAKERTEALRVIARYFHGKDRRYDDSMVRRQTAALEKMLDLARDTYGQMASARSYAKSVTSGLSSYASLANLGTGVIFQGPGNNGAAAAAMSMETSAKQDLASLRTFAGVLRKLSAAHLPGSLLRQIAAMGPAQGTAMGNELLAGGGKLIRQLSGTERQISTAEGDIGRGAASAVYSGVYRSSSRSYLRFLQEQRSDYYNIARGMGQRMGQELARWLHVPWHAAGMDAIVSGPTLLGAGEAGPERVTITPLRGGKPGGQAPVVALTNNGDVIVRNTADLGLISQRLSAAIVRSGMSAGQGGP